MTNRSSLRVKNILLLNIVTILVLIILVILFPPKTFFENLPNIEVSSKSSDVEYEKTSQNILPTTVYSGVDPFAKETSTFTQCSGSWVDLKSTERIDLDYENLHDWSMESSPSIIDKTRNSENIVIIGHNWCPYGNCFKAGSEFAKIIDSKVGDEASLCLNGKLFSGYVVISEAIPDNQIEVLGDWLGIPSVTLFTSYGNCKTPSCISTDQRWLVAFSRN